MEPKNYKLYVHICPNGKRYYGITKKNPSRRWENGHGYKKNQHFFRAIEKYGWDNIEHIILHDSLTEHEAKELEQYYIQWYDTANKEHGYNISLGGDYNPMLGKHHTDETKARISKAHIGKHHSDEAKKKMSKNSKGKNQGGNNGKSKKVICLDTSEIFQTVTSASKSVNGGAPGLSQAMKDNRPYKGYTFKYLDTIII